MQAALRSWYRFGTRCIVLSVQIVHGSGHIGKDGRSETHRRLNPLGWGPKGRWFKSSRPDSALTRRIQMPCAARQVDADCRPRVDRRLWLWEAGLGPVSSRGCARTQKGDGSEGTAAGPPVGRRGQCCAGAHTRRAPEQPAAAAVELRRARARARRARARRWRRPRLLTLTGPGGCGKTRLGCGSPPSAADRFPTASGGSTSRRSPRSGWSRRRSPRRWGCGRCRASPSFRPSAPTWPRAGRWSCSITASTCSRPAPRPPSRFCRPAPEVAVLATSRAPLGVAGETDWRVPSLSLPDGRGDGALPDPTPSRSSWSAPARSRPGFAVTDGERRSVVRALPRARRVAIGDRAGGGARANALAPSRSRPGSRTASACSPAGRAPPWSACRPCGRRSTGATSCSPPRSSDCCGAWRSSPAASRSRPRSRSAPGTALEPELVLDLLGSLVDQSLVIAEQRGPGTRYRLLETVREYALERLAEAGEEEALRGRHRDLLPRPGRGGGSAPRDRCASASGSSCSIPRRPTWRRRSDYALGSEPPLALRFCAALYRTGGARAAASPRPSWRIRARWRPPATASPPCARVSCSPGHNCNRGGRLEAARGARDGGPRARGGGRRRGDGGPGALPARFGRACGKPPAARAEFARAAELARAAGDDWALVDAGS